MEGLLHAINASNINAVRECLRAPDVVQDLNSLNLTPLQLAAARPNSDIVELLLRAGASPNVQDRHTGTSPLLNALDRNYEANIRLLIDSGADPNVSNNSGITPLYAAHYPRKITMLLSANADPRLPGAEPCLIKSAVFGYIEVVKALIAAGADPSAVSPRSGWSPLHMAARHCHPEVIDVLLAAGADALATDQEGDTPLRWIHFGPPQQRHAMISALVAAGDRKWEHVLTPCAGLQRAMIPTWKDAPEELSELFKRLEPEVQARARAALNIFHPWGLPEALRMDLLSASLE